MEGGSSARGAAAALSTLCLLLAAVAWRLSVPAGVAAGGGTANTAPAQPAALSGSHAAEGMPSSRWSRGNGGINTGSPGLLALPPALVAVRKAAVGGAGASPTAAGVSASPGRLQALTEGDGTLAGEIARMTSTLGEELENEIQGALLPSGKTEGSDPERWLMGPPFQVGGIRGNYVGCGDSVAYGALGENYLNGDLDKVRRFHGDVGELYAIRCPAHCGRWLSYSLVYGCDPYLDASSICMAAIMDNKIGYKSGGDIIIKLVPPIPHYKTCWREVHAWKDVEGANMPERGRGQQLPPPYKKLWSTMPFSFDEWNKADGAQSLTMGSYHNNKELLQFRSTCQYPEVESDIGCAGRRAFVIMNLRQDGEGANPVLSPASGSYPCPLLVDIYAPKQRIFFTDDGSYPLSHLDLGNNQQADDFSAKDTSHHSGHADTTASTTASFNAESTAKRYQGPFYFDKEGYVKICAVAYDENSFPPTSAQVCEEYEITMPEHGCGPKPAVVEQKSLSPSIQGKHQQYLPGKVFIKPPSSVHNVLLPEEKPKYEIFFAVAPQREEVERIHAHSCGAGNQKFVSKVTSQGGCEIELPGGVWYIQAKGLSKGAAPCEGCDPYGKSEGVTFGPMMVKSKDGSAFPPHFSPHTATFFANTGLISIAVAMRHDVLFTLDGTVPVEGAANTAVCGTDFDYGGAVISSMYGPKGCEVAFPEGRWMPCSVSKNLDCDKFCKMLNRSLSLPACAGPIYVVPPPTEAKVYPTWEANDVPATLPPAPTIMGGMGADAWLGDPGKLVIKLEPAARELCFEIKELVRGEMRPDLTLSTNWPKPKCDTEHTFTCGKPAPAGIFEGPDALRKGAVVITEQKEDRCEVFLPDGEWLVGVRENNAVENCHPPTKSQVSSDRCIVSEEGVSNKCSICPLVPPGNIIKLGPFLAGPKPPCDPGTTGPAGGPCIDCIAGTYKEVSGDAKCTACPPNTHSAVASSRANACVADIGYTGPDGGPATACPAGTYKTIPGSAACRPCPENTATEATANSAVTACQAMPGFMGPDGGPVVKCAVGTYKETVGSATCDACPPNSESPLASVSGLACIANPGYTGPDGGPFSECASGAYKEVPGSSACSVCPENSDSAVASDSSMDCVASVGFTGPDGGPFTACPTGTYKGTLGSAPCSGCPPNSNTIAEASDGINSCKAMPGFTGPDGGPFTSCHVGTFKEAVGDAACLRCPPNSETPTVASVEPLACKAMPGFTGPDGGTFTECASGTYKNGLGDSQCIGCPIDSLSSPASVAPSDCVSANMPPNADGGCPEGYTGPDGGPCKACPQGSFKNLAGSSACIKCPLNSYSPMASKGSSACLCNAGFSGADCVACSSGKFKDARGNSECSDCPSRAISRVASARVADCVAGVKLPGENGQCSEGYTGALGGPCNACPQGTFKEIIGSAACSKCPAGSDSPMASVDIQSCSCNAGYTGDDGGACEACPVGTFKETPGGAECSSCPSDSASSPGSISIVDCVAGTQVPGPGGLCRKGYTGPTDGPCNACAAGTYKEAPGSDACTDCPPNSVSSAGSEDVSACEANSGYTGPVPPLLPSAVGKNGGKGEGIIACPIGTYKSDKGSMACSVCPANSETAAVASVDVFACKAKPGFTGPDGGPFTQCPLGTFKDSLGSDACSECPADTSSAPASDNAASCVPLSMAPNVAGECAPGYSGPIGGPCRACVQGTFKDVRGSEACSRCPMNSISPIASSDSAACECNIGFTRADGIACSACAAGTYKDVIGSASCSSCPVDSISGAASVSEAECVAATAAANARGECREGYTGSIGGPCIACVQGTFKNVAGSGSCQGCPENSMSPMASSDASACTCNAGHTGSSGHTCTACAAGTYKDAVGTGSCSSCPSGLVSAVASTSSADCLIATLDPNELGECGVGYTGPIGGPCNACAQGTFKDTVGSAACTECPANSLTPLASRDATACQANPGFTGPHGGPFTACPSGTYKGTAGSSPCTACPSSTVSSIASASIGHCVPATTAPDAHGRCPAGFTGPDGGPCSACMEGTFKSKPGSAPCASCPANSNSSPASVDSTACHADPGFTGPDGGPFTACPSGTFKDSVGDVACTDCPHTGNAVSIVASTSVGDCVPATWPPGANGECPVGYKGDISGPCDACPSGTFKDTAGTPACTVCPAQSESTPASTSSAACMKPPCQDGLCCKGFTGPIGGPCTACPEGTYKDILGSAACTECPGHAESGAASEKEADCVPTTIRPEQNGECPAGYTGAVGGPCNACPPGTFKDTAGSATCTECPEKSSSPAASVVSLACTLPPNEEGSCLQGYTGPIGGPCGACAEGSYKDAVGSAACAICPENMQSALASVSETACIRSGPMAKPVTGEDNCLATGECTYLGGYRGYVKVTGPPVECVDDSGYGDEEMTIRTNCKPQLPVRACTRNHNLCTMVRDNCKEDPLRPCSFACLSEDGQQCGYEGNSFSSVPFMSNPLNGMQVPMLLMPTVKYQCPAKIVQASDHWDPNQEWLDEKDTWVYEKSLQNGTDKLTEGYQEIPYDGCVRIDKPEDTCYCVFISGAAPENRAMFDSIMAPA